MESNRIVLIESKSKVLQAGLISIMSALTTVFTMVVSIYIPASNGFFNIGESMVYVSAILFGPYIGALSGGLGSMIADLLLGYPMYAPGTLIIKGIEGYLVGYVYFVLSKKGYERKYRIIGVLFVSSLLIVGAVLYTLIGSQEYEGLTNLWNLTVPEALGTAFWIIFVAISLLIISLLLIKKKFNQETANKITSMLLGGIIIVVGYLLYGTFLYGTAAFIEIPFNIMQCLVGILIALPIVSWIEKKNALR